MTKSTHIAVIGTGAIGQSLGRQWYEAGHRVTFGSRNPNSPAHGLKTSNDGTLSITGIEQATRAAEVIVLAVPHASLSQIADAIRPFVDHKIVVDCTNAVEFTPDGRLASGLTTDETEGRYAARLFPESHVVRAFTHIQDELLGSRGRRQPGIWAVAIAGDDPSSKSLVKSLAQDTGFVPVDIGTLDESAPLDPGGVLFPNMFTPTDMRRVAKVAA